MSDAPRLIEVNVHEVKQLFNSMDPSPFHERDLDRDADEYIVSWAQEFPLDSPVSLRVHLEEWPSTDPVPVIADAVHHYYAYRADLARLEFHRIMKEGRAALTIGLLFLAACLMGSRALPSSGRIDWVWYLRESLTIAGWVAMWRPMETYLYDWWPVQRRRRVFTKLSEMPIEVVATRPSAIRASHLLEETGFRQA